MSEVVEVRIEWSGRRAASGVRSAMSWQPSVPLLLAAPLLLFMLAFYAVPVLSMLMRSVNDPAWTLSHYAFLTGDTVFLKVLSNTLVTSLIVTWGPWCWVIPSLSRWCARRVTRR